MNFKVFRYIVILLLFFSCNEKESFEEVHIVSHGVSGLYNPQSFHIDNTKEAMDYVLKFEELDGIEIDVQYSADKSLWMFHDEFLDDRTSTAGRICEKSDEVLSEVNYTGVNNTPLSQLISIDWTINEGSKNIYLDLKNLNSCEMVNYTPNDLLIVLNELSELEGLTFYPIIKDTSFASVIHNAGYDVYADAVSFDEAKIQLSSFYYGVFIRNAELSSAEVADLQINNKKVILFDVFSLKGVREGFNKHPSALLVEDFKSAIIERN